MRCSMKKSLKCFTSDNFDWAHLLRSSDLKINPLDWIGLDWSLCSFSCTNLRSLWGCVFPTPIVLFWWNFQLDTVLNRSLLQHTNSVSKFFLALLLPQLLSLSRLLSLSIFSSSSFTFKGHKGGTNTCWSSTDAKAAAFYLKSSFATRLVQGLDLGPIQ